MNEKRDHPLFKSIKKSDLIKYSTINYFHLHNLCIFK